MNHLQTLFAQVRECHRISTDCHSWSLHLPVHKFLSHLSKVSSIGADNRGYLRQDLRWDLRLDMMQSSVGGSSLGDKLLENYTGLLPVLWKAVVRWKERSQYEKLGESRWRHQAHGNMQRLLDGHHFKETTMEGDHPCAAS